MREYSPGYVSKHAQKGRLVWRGNLRRRTGVGPRTAARPPWMPTQPKKPRAALIGCRSWPIRAVLRVARTTIKGARVASGATNHSKTR